jgi:hypothetical protein
MRKVLGVVAPMRYDSDPRIMTRVMTLHHGARYTLVMTSVMTLHHDAHHRIAS